MVAKSQLTKYELLKEFLSRLSTKKHNDIADIQRDLTVITRDLESVTKKLDNWEGEPVEVENTKFTSVPNTQGVNLLEIDTETCSTESSELSDKVNHYPGA